MVEQKLNQRCLAPAGSFSFIQYPPEHIAAVVMVGDGNGWEGAWKTRTKRVWDYVVESFSKGTVIAAPGGGGSTLIWLKSRGISYYVIGLDSLFLKQWKCRHFFLHETVLTSGNKNRRASFGLNQLFSFQTNERGAVVVSTCCWVPGIDWFWALLWVRAVTYNTCWMFFHLQCISKIQ